jgi:hypothetical protein
VSWLEVRADRIGDIPPGRLRQNFGGKLLYSLGRTERDDAGNGNGLNRSRRLIAAAGKDTTIVNATPVGTQGDDLPFSIDHLAREAVVVDLVYASGITPLAAGARARGVRVVEGRQVLLAQVEKQFSRMTGLAPPIGLVADMLGLSSRVLARGSTHANIAIHENQ